ncbi:hypothetical protein ACS5NO_26590 [Larkinella sp. GY13]|uniref:hypothetical protein n=1 Tax=Larkinella sp. GY13 TaxID=3453720 RepID=UPI003EEA5B8B
MNKISHYPDSYVQDGKISGFTHPQLPIITQEIQLFQWGLLPAWAKEDQAAELANMTLNARVDLDLRKTVFSG